MNRLLWRLVPITLLALLLASAAVYLLFSRLYGDPLEDIARRQAAGQIFLLEHYIDQAPADEWLTRLNKAREVSPQLFELLPLDEALGLLHGAQRGRLEKGELVLDVAGAALLRRVDLQGLRYVDSDREVLRISRLPVDVGDSVRREAIRLAVVAAFLLLPLIWWSRAHWRSLRALSQTVLAWATGRLSERAPVIAGTSLQPLAEGMNHMAARLDALLEGRRHLLHAVSHELRTPIARLGFGLELLRGADSPAQRNARIDALARDLDELQTLVTELLMHSRLEQSPPQLTPVDLTALLQQCLAVAEEALAGRALQADIAPDLGQMPADARQLARAVSNLLSNALKYARGRILLTARPSSATRWQLSVEDDGPGVAEAERQRIFEPFVRLQRGEDEGLPGHGLGLAIAARVVSLHGGRIWVETGHRLGGARFVIDWPREAP